MAERTIRVARLAGLGLLVLLFLVCAIVLLMRFVVGPRLSFERLVIRPIPPSVHNIKLNRCEISTLAERLDGNRQETFVLRFEIAKEDLPQIVAAHGLKRGENAECTHGTVHYEFTTGPDARQMSDMDLYREKRRPAPSWFDLERWTDIQTYVLERGVGEDYLVDVGLLLYSEQFGSAYFIRYRGEVFGAVMTSGPANVQPGTEDTETEDGLKR